MTPDFSRARLSQDLEHALHDRMISRKFAKGAVLYEHGTPAAGIYLVQQGSVRVLLTTPDNQRQLLEVVGAGAVLGLSESMCGDRYRVTAEAEEPATTQFVARDSFIDFLDTHHEYCMQVVRILSENLHGLYHKFRSVSAHPGRPRRRMLNEQLN